MFKTVVYRYSGRVWPYCRANHCLKMMKHGELVRSYSAYKAHMNLYSSWLQNHTFKSRSSTVTYYAQNAWKRISRLCSYRAPYLPLTATVACAMGLALTRSHPLVLETYASITKGFTLRRVWAGLQLDYLPEMNDLCVHQQVAGVRLTSLVLSCLDHLRLYVRAIYLAILFSPTIAMSPFIDTFGVEFRKKWLYILVLSLEKAGPAFIAWGRWAATRPDLFPKDLCVELSKIQNKGQVHSFSHTQKTIEEAFGRKLPEIFDDFEVEPIASGVFFQVHRAKLRFQYPGKQIKPAAVAIKVRHPCIKESFRIDFAIIRQFAKSLRFISSLKGLRLEESLEQFEALMNPKVDLSKRAAHLAQLIIMFKRMGDMSFPKPLYPLVHPAILVERYEEGEFLSRYVDGEIELEQRIKKNIILAGSRAALKMLVVNKSVLGGMHPENILIRVHKGRHHITFLDSMLVECSVDESINFVKLFEAVGARDGPNVAECTLRLSKRQTCPNPDAFTEDVEKSFKIWITKKRGKGRINSLKCMHMLLEKVRIHNVSIDPNISTMITSLLTLQTS